LKGLKELMEEKMFKKYIIVSRDRNEGIKCHYYENLFHKFWNKEL
jgi:hypothetical protein